VAGWSQSISARGRSCSGLLRPHRQPGDDRRVGELVKDRHAQARALEDVTVERDGYGQPADGDVVDDGAAAVGCGDAAADEALVQGQDMAVVQLCYLSRA
jgi:hypothetical protein